MGKAPVFFSSHAFLFPLVVLSGRFSPVGGGVVRAFLGGWVGLTIDIYYFL